jgi:hypothetical protein
MAHIERIASLSNKLHCQARLKRKLNDLPDSWGNGIGLPVRTYIEINGPWPFRELDWLEINPVVMEHIGRLVAPKRHNYLNDIIELLNSEEIPYLIIEGMVRVPFKAFE